MSELGPITGQEKVIDVFGYWPSFHDATDPTYIMKLILALSYLVIVLVTAGCSSIAGRSMGVVPPVPISFSTGRLGRTARGRPLSRLDAVSLRCH
jgi:hypothetical protein